MHTNIGLFFSPKSLAIRDFTVNHYIHLVKYFTSSLFTNRIGDLELTFYVCHWSVALNVTQQCKQRQWSYNLCLLFSCCQQNQWICTLSLTYSDMSVVFSSSALKVHDPFPLSNGYNRCCIRISAERNALIQFPPVLK